MNRNYDKVQVGTWYQSASGELVQIVDKHPTAPFHPYKGSNGTYYSDEGTSEQFRSSKNLLLELEPISVVPVRRKRIVEVKRYANFYPSEGVDLDSRFMINYATKEQAMTSAFPGVVQVEFTAQVEVE